MDRKYIVVGDAPTGGGAVLPFTCRPGDTIDGHQKALIGGRVFCAECNSVGFIAKAGGPYRPTVCDIEYALEGDMVECGCPQPSPLVSSKHNRAWCDDRSGLEGLYSPSLMGSDWYCANPKGLDAKKKAVSCFVTLPPNPVEEAICPNMSDEEIREKMLEVRDRAIYLTRLRLRELDDWDGAAQEMVRLWFGKDDNEIRAYLKKGLNECILIMGWFAARNFVRYSEALVKKLGAYRTEKQRMQPLFVKRTLKRTPSC